MIYIQDNTIRDGMQQNSVKKNVATKKKIIREISKTEISSVEIGMCDSKHDTIILKEYLKNFKK